MRKLTHGSLFAGIGGFDIGFGNAGFETVWQVEINPVNRAVLADRFPGVCQFSDIRECGAEQLGGVDCITAGFPCQDVSLMGSVSERTGLQGERTGLFRQVIRIVEETRPAWVVFENVVGLLTCHDGKDFQTVLQELARCGYVGYWRVLDAMYFGVPQSRRRVFVVAGFGRYPHADFLADAAPVDKIPTSPSTIQKPRSEGSFPGYCLTAKDVAVRLAMGNELLVAETDGWDQMAERERMSEVHGVRLGVDDECLFRSYAAGNAVVPSVAQWVAEKILMSYPEAANE